MNRKTKRWLATAAVFAIALLANALRGEPAGVETNSPAAVSASPHVIDRHHVGGVSVVDINSGRRIDLGTVDLQPTLKRIAAGRKNAHRNDGSVFQNRSRLLPVKPSGYYREYVVPTKGISGAGPQRLIVGRGGEAYYTHDHYETFIPLPGGK